MAHAGLLLQSCIMSKIYCSNCGSYITGKDGWVSTDIEWVPKCRSCRERDAADELEKYKKQIELEISKTENETARQKLENDMRRRDAADELEKYKKQIELEISKTENETERQKLKSDMEKKLKEMELAAKHEFEKMRVEAEKEENVMKLEHDLKIKEEERKREEAEHKHLSELEDKKINWDKDKTEKTLQATKDIENAKRETEKELKHAELQMSVTMKKMKIKSKEKMEQYVADKKAEAVIIVAKKKSDSIKKMETQRIKALDAAAARREALFKRLALKSADTAKKFEEKLLVDLSHYNSDAAYAAIASVKAPNTYRIAASKEGKNKANQKNSAQLPDESDDTEEDGSEEDGSEEDGSEDD